LATWRAGSQLRATARGLRRYASKPSSPPSEGERSAGGIAASLREHRIPDLNRAYLPQWAAALNMLMNDGHLEAAEFGARHLYAAHPAVSYSRNLCAAFDRMPAAGRQLPFADDPGKELQAVPRQGADTALILFCGAGHRLGAPVPFLHRWLGLLPAHLIYLRDFRQLFYLAGLDSLGPDRAATLQSLRALVASLGATRIVCYGNSAGGFAALHYGLDLGAESVLAMNGPTNLDVGFNTHLRMYRTAKRVGEEVPDAVTNLRSAYEAAADPPRALLVYGNGQWDDRLQAEDMAGLPTVTLCPMEKVKEHNTAMQAILRDQFQDLLDWLVR
jgi:hypothetical protein